jgi:hypothetical protein
MTSSKERLSGWTQVRGGFSGFVSRRRASWVWYDTHLPLSRAGQLLQRVAPSKGNSTAGSQGTS